MYISIYLYNNTSAWCCKCNERKTHFHVMTKQLPFSGLINKTNDPIDPVTYLIFIYCWVGESHCRKIDEDWISIKAIHTFIGVFIYTASHDNMPWNRRFTIFVLLRPAFFASTCNKRHRTISSFDKSFDRWQSVVFIITSSAMFIFDMQ